MVRPGSSGVDALRLPGGLRSDAIRSDLTLRGLIGLLFGDCDYTGNDITLPVRATFRRHRKHGMAANRQGAGSEIQGPDVGRLW